ncbi:MAG: Crp/Fnr family transcriptional regulator [Brotaphodocola sp.]
MENHTNSEDLNSYEFLDHLISLPRGIVRLEKLGIARKYPKGKVINNINEIPEYCYLVKSGRVLGYEITCAGDQRVFNFMEPGSIFLESFVLFDKPCPILFKAVMDSELIAIHKCTLKRAFKHDIDVVMDICEALSMKFLSSMEDIRTLPQQSAAWKICRLLLNFADHYGEQYNKMILIKENINQQMLADLLGMNRITVTRKLKELKDCGLIDKSNGFYYICDIDKFRVYMRTIQTD